MPGGTANESVTVIIPTYNRPRLLLDRALPSVRTQGHANIEVLVVGDGTDAATVDGMREIVEVDRRVQFFNLPHAEQPSDPMLRYPGLESLNFALDRASGA